MIASKLYCAEEPDPLLASRPQKPFLSSDARSPLELPTFNFTHPHLQPPPTTPHSDCVKALLLKQLKPPAAGADKENFKFLRKRDVYAFVSEKFTQSEAAAGFRLVSSSDDLFLKVPWGGGLRLEHDFAAHLKVTLRKMLLHAKSTLKCADPSAMSGFKSNQLARVKVDHASAAAADNLTTLQGIKLIQPGAKVGLRMFLLPTTYADTYHLSARKENVGFFSSLLTQCTLTGDSDDDSASQLKLIPLRRHLP